MADFVHRTTRQVVSSGHSPNYPSQDWIRVSKADMAALANVSPEYWYTAGDAIREMTSQEKAAVDAAMLAGRKLAALQTVGEASTALAGSARRTYLLPFREWIAAGIAELSSRFSAITAASTSAELAAVPLTFDAWLADHPDPGVSMFVAINLSAEAP